MTEPKESTPGLDDCIAEVSTYVFCLSQKVEVIHSEYFFLVVSKTSRIIYFTFL